jgi:Mor family transcriptional regulator
MIHRNTERNRAIFVSHQNGETINELAEQYGLATSTVSQIITTEKHLRALSMEPIYKTARRGNKARVP